MLQFILVPLSVLGGEVAVGPDPPPHPDKQHLLRRRMTSIHIATRSAGVASGCVGGASDERSEGGMIFEPGMINHSLGQLERIAEQIIEYDLIG